MKHVRSFGGWIAPRVNALAMVGAVVLLSLAAFRVDTSAGLAALGLGLGYLGYEKRGSK